jgi:mono/diheme cytochrome c family protein
MVDFSRTFPDKPAEAATFEFGRYLVNTSCVGCHGVSLEGGPVPGGPPEWPHSANIRLGEQPGWDAQKFESALRTGVSPRTGAQIRFPMPIAVTKQMTDIEVQAIWMYLSSLKHS